MIDDGPRPAQEAAEGASCSDSGATSATSACSAGDAIEGHIAWHRLLGDDMRVIWACAEGLILRATAAARWSKKRQTTC
jgi:hypothetical protein